MAYRIVSPFLKSDWYPRFAGNEQVNATGLFAMLDPEQHGQRRKLLGQHFTDTWTKRPEPSIAKNAWLAVATMNDEMEAQAYADVLKRFVFMVCRALSCLASQI